MEMHAMYFTKEELELLDAAFEVLHRGGEYMVFKPMEEQTHRHERLFMKFRSKLDSVRRREGN